MSVAYLLIWGVNIGGQVRRGSMQTLVEVYRTAFPKQLRYDKASQIFYAELYILCRRLRHKKYIPKADIEAILARYEPTPGPTWVTLPVVRHALLLRPLNAVRVHRGKKSWLYNRSIGAEHAKVVEWMTTQRRNDTSRASRRGSTSHALGRTLGDVVERESFQREVLDCMHIATVYQRMVRLGLVMVAVLILFLYASVHMDMIVYLYVRHWKRRNREDILQWFRDITEAHAVTEIPPGYESFLPPPCVRYRPPNSDADSFAVNVVELISEDKRVVVVAIPCPLMGEKDFYQRVGKIARACDIIIMEGVPLESIDKIAPAAFLPLKYNTFPSLGVHHRFLDILTGTEEPPKLHPAGSPINWNVYFMQLLVPFELRCVYEPTKLSATKGEARVGWGKLREIIEEVAAKTDEGGSDAPPHVICVPWTINHIVNMEASLVKYGFKVKNVFSLHWIAESHLGEHFCSHFAVT